MHKGNSSSPMLKNKKPTRLNDYKSWFHSKQKSQILIKQLQRLNENLVAKINLLQKQNSELVSYKQKYLALNLEQIKPTNEVIKKQKNHSKVCNTDKKHSSNSVGETEYGYFVKGKNVQSDTKQQHMSDFNFSTQRVLFDDKIFYKLEQKLVQKRKRFNYISNQDQIQIKSTCGSLNKTIDSKSVEATRMNKGKQLHQSIYSSIGKQKQFSQENIQRDKKISEGQILVSTQYSKSIRNLNAQVLQKQLNQMRRIQGQLLDRIQQRDQIIQGLKNLITQT